MDIVIPRGDGGDDPQLLDRRRSEYENGGDKGCLIDIKGHCLIMGNGLYYFLFIKRLDLIRILGLCNKLNFIVPFDA